MKEQMSLEYMFKEVKFELFLLYLSILITTVGLFIAMLFIADKLHIQIQNSCQEQSKKEIEK